MKILRMLMAVVLSLACVPAAAFASEVVMPTFTIDGITYQVLADYASVQVYKSDPEVVGATNDGVVILPAEVTDPDTGTSYKVSNIFDYAFENCTLIRDFRVMNLSGAEPIYKYAFTGCTNLEVFHIYGDCGFIFRMHLDNTVSDGFAGCKLIYHAGTNIEPDEVFASNSSTANMQNGASSYVSVTYVTSDGEETELFVRGPALSESGSYVDGVLIGDLGNLSEDDIYCDAERYASSPELIAAPNSEVPAYTTGSAWSFTSLSGVQYFAEDALNVSGVATEVAPSNLDFAAMTLGTTDYDYDGLAGKSPQVTVVDALNDTVAASNYELSYYYGADLASATLLGSVDEVVECGTYWIVATGIGEYSGSCSASFTVTFVESTWTRANGGAVSNTTNLRHLLSFQARAKQSGFTSSSGASIDTSEAIVVNGDDYASCVVATSLASLFNCSIITVDENCIRESNGKLTATNVSNYASVLTGKLAIVLGNSDYISDTVYEAVQETVGSSGKVTRFDTEDCVSAAQIAEMTYAMVRAVEDGEFELGVSRETYSNAAMIVPSTGSASVFSALVYANTNNMAVFFADSAGRVSSKTLTYLEDFDEVYVAGFEAEVAATVQEAMPADLACTCWNESGDTFASSAAYAEACLAAGTNTCTTIAVCSNNDYGRMAAVAAQVGWGNSVMLVCDDSDEAAATLNTFVTAHQYEIYYGYVFATYLEIPLATQINAQAIRMQESATQMEFATVEATTSYAYTGEAIEPVVSVTASDGTALTQNSEYLLYYYKSTTGRGYYTTTTESYVSGMSTQNVVVATTSTMIDEGTYTVVVEGNYTEITRDTTVTGTVGTYEGQTSFTITIGQADEITDYTAAYVDVIDESDYAQAEEEPALGDDEGLSGTDPEGSDAGSDGAEGTDASAGDSGSADSEAKDQGAAETLAAQKISVKAAAKTLKVKKLKKKAVTCKFKVAGAHTTLVAKAANKKSKKALKVKVSGKTVKVTVARGTKKGVYKVKVYAKANSSYAKSAAKTISIKVK